MLKHVSYRASSTSLSRPFGNCRANTLSPQEKSHLSGSSINSSIIGPISAPNSPRMCQFNRHTRNHSVTPTSESCSSSSQDEVDSPCIRRSDRHHQTSSLHRHTTSGSILKGSSLPRTSEEASTVVADINLINNNNNISKDQQDDSILLKADDPLSRHRNELTSVDCLTLKGELMPDLPPHTDNSDNISLHSAISMTSLCRNDLRASTTSLCASKVPVRIHLRQLRPDIEYKTLSLYPETTCRQLIEHLLQKLRLKHRDPNLFAVVLEAAVRGPGGAPPVKKRFLLEDSARPVELQQCRPRGEANFSITMRRGGVLKVRDSVLTPGSQYKSFLVAYTSSVVEVIQLLLRCNNRNDDWRMFTLHEVCSEPYADRLLNDADKPLNVQVAWPKNDKQKYSLVLRRHLTQGLIESRDTWRRLSIDECCLDVELDEHNSTCSSILTTSSNSSRSRSSISSSTASVLSLASLSSNTSSRCSFSSNSSSGVSSGSSSSYSPNETPEKDRKIHKRQLPPTPITPTPITRKYSISAEENIQSYFSVPRDDEIESPSKGETCVVLRNEPSKVSKRPPQPLPRRFLNFAPVRSLSSESDDAEVFDSEEVISKDTNKTFSKSFSSSSCFSPSVWIKARGPAAHAWQTRSRSARIRSATISSIEHMTNLSIHNRSRSNDPLRLSTTTLTSQPSTPTPSTPDKSINKFTFSPLPSMSRAQSTSSINNSVTSYKSVEDHPIKAPLSSKLRPLSLAPNSSIAFPARPCSLLSSQSQSSTTLRGSSSTLSISTPSPDGHSSFHLSLNKANSASPKPIKNSTYLPAKQSTEVVVLNQPTISVTPTKPSSVRDVKLVASNDRQIVTEYIKLSHDLTPKKHVSGMLCQPISITTKCQDQAPLPSNGNKSHNDTKSHRNNCSTSCRYDNCFYI